MHDFCCHFLLRRTFLRPASGDFAALLCFDCPHSLLVLRAELDVLCVSHRHDELTFTHNIGTILAYFLFCLCFCPFSPVSLQFFPGFAVLWALVVTSNIGACPATSLSVFCLWVVVFATFCSAFWLACLLLCVCVVFLCCMGL